MIRIMIRSRLEEQERLYIMLATSTLSDLKSLVLTIYAYFSLYLEDKYMCTFSFHLLECALHVRSESRQMSGCSLEMYCGRKNTTSSFSMERLEQCFYVQTSSEADGASGHVFIILS